MSGRQLGVGTQLCPAKLVQTGPRSLKPALPCKSTTYNNLVRVVQVVRGKTTLFTSIESIALLKEDAYNKADRPDRLDRALQRNGLQGWVVGPKLDQPCWVVIFEQLFLAKLARMVDS